MWKGNVSLFCMSQLHQFFRWCTGLSFHVFWRNYDAFPARSHLSPEQRYQRGPMTNWQWIIISGWVVSRQFTSGRRFFSSKVKILILLHHQIHLRSNCCTSSLAMCTLAMSSTKKPLWPQSFERRGQINDWRWSIQTQQNSSRKKECLPLFSPFLPFKLRVAT
jgi:hypothetical protein